MREIARIFKDKDSHYYNPDLLLQTLKVYMRTELADRRDLDEICKEIKPDVEYLGKISSRYSDELNNYYLKLKKIKL